MQYLKQSTASQSALLGPFVDSTDGNTAETGLTIANTDIRLSANGGNMAAKNSGGGTHDEAGWYTITLDATDTATVGRLQVSVHVAGALPVFAEFQVLEEAVYDTIFGSGATLDVNVTKVAGQTASAAATVNFDDIASILVDTGTTLPNEHATLATAAALTTVDTVVDGIQTDLDNATDGLGALKTLIDTVDTNVDAILVDTAEIGAAGAGLTAINLPNQTMDITGNLSGSVGSVTGAVGSVTGHTAQTGDTYALANGATGFAAIDAVVDGIQADLDNGTDGLGALKTLIDALNDVSTSDVLTQVNAAIDTAISELGVAAPTATPSLRTGLMLLYMALRNKTVVQTSGTDALEIYNDAGTKIASKLLTDDGSDYTEAEMA